MPRDPLKEKLAALEALRRDAGAEIGPQLKRALSDKHNYVVAKAAAIVAERAATELIPDLLVAFDRLIAAGKDGDPLCTGKKAIAQALKDLDHRDPDPFARGLRCVQFEPIYGGKIDTAAGLRAICALAYASSDAQTYDVLRALVDCLGDPYKEVRIEAVRGIGDAGGTESILLLRLKAIARDPNAEVVGQCYASLLRREQGAAVALIANALDDENPAIVFEAATTLAGSREPAAFAEVERFWFGPVSLDLRRAILASLAESPLPAAADFLLAAINDSRGDLAQAAVAALVASRFGPAYRERAFAAASATGNGAIIRACSEAFDP